jgi:uncharacterized protein YcbK (DUF882 family)
MKYFTIRELTRTSTGIRNVPGRMELRNLELLVEKVLDPVREIYGKPITVTSGYRSPAVNRKVGGAINSHHVRGMAADINGVGDDPKENRKIYDIIRTSGIKFTQLINEYPDKDGNPNWVHVSYDPENLKCQRLTIRKK